MKKLILTLLLTLNVSAIEIQCFSEVENIHSTIVKEENSPRTFLVFDNGENFLNYFQLDQTLINVTDSEFTYLDEDIQIDISSSRDGSITSTSEDILLGKAYSKLVLTNCKFINIEI